MSASETQELASGRRLIHERIWKLQHRYAPYFFIAPFILLFTVFMLYPLGWSIWLSLHQYAGPRLARWVGLGQYRFLLADRLFWIACANTALFTLLFLPLELILSLGLACLLNSRLVCGRNVLRFAFFSTYLVGQVFLAVLSHVLLAPRHGLVNLAISRLFPWVGSEINWTGKMTLAMPAIVLVSLWVSIGYAMVYWLAALQSVDRELYDAAAVDGAGPWLRFRHVTLPGIRPVGIFLLLAGTIASLSLFDLPYVFFQGPGPGFAGMTVVMYLYEQGFQTGDIGYAAAVGWVLLVLILVVTLVEIRLTRPTQDT